MGIQRAGNGHNLRILFVLCGLLFGYTCGWTPIVVKNIVQLGPQITPDVTRVSRDGGYSVLLSGQIIWLYDDTECLDRDGKQLSFVSNTAAYAKDANKNVSMLVDFGVEAVGKDKKTGQTNYAILADTTVATGGWISFSRDELEFNDKRKGVERVAICTICFFTTKGVLTFLNRAWHFAYSLQHQSSTSFRPSGIRRQQASRSFQGIPSPGDDVDIHRCVVIWPNGRSPG